MRNHRFFKVGLLSLMLSSGIAAWNSPEAHAKETYEQLLKRFDVLLQKGKGNEARAVAAKAIKMHGDRCEGYAAMARLEADHDTKLAMINAKKAFELNPSSEVSTYVLGLANARSKNFEQALRYYANSLEINPNAYKVYHQRAHLYLDMGKPELALPDSNKEISIKANAHSYDLRALIESKLGKVKESIEDSNKAIRMEPSALNYENRADRNLLAGAYGAALKDYAHAIHKKPEKDLQVKFLCMTAFIHFKNNNLSAAIKGIEKAIKVDPTCINAQLALAQMQYMQGQHLEALSTSEKIIEREPSCVAAYGRKLVILMELKRFAEAFNTSQQWLKYEPTAELAISARDICISSVILQEQWERVASMCAEGLKITPTNSSLFSNRISALFKLKQWTEALRDLDTAIQLQPNIASHHLNRAVVLTELHQEVKSVEESTKAIELDPSNSLAYYRRAWAQEVLGNSEAATSDVSEALRLGTESVWIPHYLDLRAWLYREQNKLDKAQIDLADLITLTPKSSNAHSLKGLVLLKQGKLLQAAEEFNEAIRLDPRNEEALLGRSFLFISWGRADRAIEDCMNVLKVNPKNSAAYNNLGEAYRVAGKFQKAIDSFTQALELDPNWLNPLNNRARVYKVIGQPDLADRDLLKVRQLTGSTHLDLRVRPMDA